MKAYSVNVLILEERYPEALAKLQAIDIKQIGKQAFPVITNRTAWCVAQLGDPAKAIGLTQSVLAELERMGAEYSSSGHLVLDASNFLLGRADEAVLHLRKACASAVSASRKAAAAFYLGESYSLLGKSGEARAAFQNAVETLPNGRYEKRARERVRQLDRS